MSFKGIISSILWGLIYLIERDCAPLGMQAAYLKIKCIKHESVLEFRKFICPKCSAIKPKRRLKMLWIIPDAVFNWFRERYMEGTEYPHLQQLKRRALSIHSD